MFNTKNDVELTPSPLDGTSCLSFSPVADYLSASSWDGQVSNLAHGNEKLNYFNYFNYFNYYKIISSNTNLCIFAPFSPYFLFRHVFGK
jgi:hypothetical protein